MCTKGRDLFAATSDESPLRGIPRSRGTVAAPGPDGDRVSTITRPSRKRREIALIPSMSRACSPGHLRASQTCYCSFSYGFEPPIPLRRRPLMHLPPSERLTTARDAPKNARRTAESEQVRRHRRNRMSALVNRSESRSLSELTRQIAPRARNGHAPPPTESRKSRSVCQSSRCPGPVRFPVLSRIKPQAPLLVVSFRQFL